MEDKELKERFDKIDNNLNEIRVAAARIEGALPHMATKAEIETVRTEVEKVSHRATKGVYGLGAGIVAGVLSLGAIASRFF